MNQWPKAHTAKSDGSPDKVASNLALDGWCEGGWSLDSVEEGEGRERMRRRVPRVMMMLL